VTQNYLPDPALSICGVGDYLDDKAPLQIGEFGQGSQLAAIMGKMWIEKGGGPTFYESYELAAYFYSSRISLTRCQLPFFFATGDEMMYPEITKD
jgi:hypothetical protein